jgi:N-acetylneuraminic acid mutarotase
LVIRAMRVRMPHCEFKWEIRNKNTEEGDRMKAFRFLVVLGIIFLILSISNVSAQNTWTTKSPMPTARGQAAIVVGNDGLIYVMGGFVVPGAEFTTVEAYDPTLDTWVTKTPMPQATRGAAVAKGLDGKIYVFGGFYINAALSTTQIYNPSTDTWALGTAMPTAQWAAGAATGNDGDIYVVGGEEVGATSSDKLQIYDPSTDTWALGTPMPTDRCELGVIKGSDGLIYAIGGYRRSTSFEPVSTVEAYDPSTDTWVTKASMPAPRVWFGLTGGSKIYAIGGGNGASYLSVNEEFVSHGHGKIYVIGGGTDYINNNPPVFDTVFAYDPSTNNWTSIPDPMPTARRELGAAAVVPPPPPPPNVKYLHSTGGLFNLTAPIGTQWHELWPFFCKQYHLSSWNDTGGDGVLSYCDWIDMYEKPDGEVKWYHVEEVTITLVVRPGRDGGVFGINGLAPPMYIELEGGYNASVLTNPVCTQWHEIYPVFCKRYHLSDWVDSGNRALDYCDSIQLTTNATEEETWWHVEEVAIDIVVTIKPPPVGGEAYPASKMSLLAPWIAVAAILAGGTIWYVLRRRRAQS